MVTLFFNRGHNKNKLNNPACNILKCKCVYYTDDKQGNRFKNYIANVIGSKDVNTELEVS